MPENDKLNVVPEKPSGASDSFSESKSDRNEAINEIGSVVRETLGVSSDVKDTETKDVEEVDDKTKDDIDDGVSKKDDLEKDVSELEGDEDDKSKLDDYEEIPEYLVEAGRSFGKTDDEIIKLSETEPQILESMARLVEERTLRPLQPRQPLKEEPEKKDEKDFKESSFKLDDSVLSKLAEDEDMSEVIDKIIKPLAGELGRVNSELNSLKKDVSGISEFSQTQEGSINISIANKAFDKASEKFPEIGKFNELPKYSDGTIVQISSQFKTRSQIYEMALGIQNQLGYDFGKSVQEALKWYAGGKNTKSGDDILKEIKSKEKKLSPKRAQKKVVKKYDSEQEENADVVRQAFKDAGAKPPEF